MKRKVYDMWKDFTGRRETFALEEKWGKDHYRRERERAGKGGEEKAAKHVTSIVFAPSGGGGEGRGGGDCCR